MFHSRDTDIYRPASWGRRPPSHKPPHGPNQNGARRTGGSAARARGWGGPSGAKGEGRGGGGAPSTSSSTPWRTRHSACARGAWCGARAPSPSGRRCPHEIRRRTTSLLHSHCAAPSPPPTKAVRVNRQHRHIIEHHQCALLAGLGEGKGVLMGGWVSKRTPSPMSSCHVERAIHLCRHTQMQNNRTLNVDSLGRA